MKAMVTGCHGDIGFAIVNYLVESTYDVLCIDTNLTRIKSLQNPKLHGFKLDLGYTDQAHEKIQSLHEPCDVFVYAAGCREIKALTELSIDEWNKVMNVNVTSAFILSQHFIKLARAHKKSLCVILISSISGLQGETHRHAYCASKHALIGLAKSMALEYAEDNIRINVIAPGLIETAMTKPYLQNTDLCKKIAENIPLKNWGHPQHIVKGVKTLIDNDYMTGTTLVIDGGWMAGKTFSDSRTLLTDK